MPAQSPDRGSALDKAPDAFRTISEVADDIDVPQHVLRFWESRFAQIRPMKRAGGRRYYRPDDIDLLRGVRHLLYGEGYTIRGVQRILREEGIGFVQMVWRVDVGMPLRGSAEDDEQIALAEREDAPSPAGSPLRALAGLQDEEPAEIAENNDNAGRREPVLEQAPPPSASLASAATIEDRRKLKSVLEELLACRELIEIALAEAGLEAGLSESAEPVADA